MKYHGLTFLLILTCSFSYGQLNKYKLLPNPESGKCYEICMQYDKKIEWVEKECAKIQEHKMVSKSDTTSICDNSLRLKQHQKKLIELGYKLDVNGKLDDKTVDAHNKYILRKEHEKRKEMRLNRRKERREKYSQ